jgi:hypothetical protein
MSGNLIDASTIRKFLELQHAGAAAALAGVDNPGVLQLCSVLPDDRVMGGGVTFSIGDVDRMTEAALTAATAGRNVFVEARTVQPGNPGERGKFTSTVGCLPSSLIGMLTPAKPVNVSMVTRLS